MSATFKISFYQILIVHLLSKISIYISDFILFLYRVSQSILDNVREMMERIEVNKSVLYRLVIMTINN